MLLLTYLTKKKKMKLLKNKLKYKGCSITLSESEFLYLENKINECDSKKEVINVLKEFYLVSDTRYYKINHITEIIKKYTDLSISHLEDITYNYARTLNIWRENFISQKNEIKKLGFSDEFINLWEFYLVYCEAGFLERNIGDYQFIFSKSGLNKVEVKY